MRRDGFAVRFYEDGYNRYAKRHWKVAEEVQSSYFPWPAKPKDCTNNGSFEHVAGADIPKILVVCCLSLAIGHECGGHCLRLALMLGIS
jgi:hypothetical protein